MVEININTSNHQESIPLLLWERDEESVAIFVSGDGDSKDSFKPIATLIETKMTSLACFSFRGRETDSEYPPQQQGEDLKEVVLHLSNLGYKDFYLIPTSAGFISAASLMTTRNLASKIKGILMLDPADYPIDNSRGTWSGRDKFDPKSLLLSSHLKNIQHEMTIDIVFFGLQNINKDLDDFYEKPIEQRGNHLQDGYTRLNIDMSRNIFDSIPEHARGSFIVDKTIPHAFERDGDVEQHRRDIAMYIQNFVESLNEN